jgi:hypothetical protein
LNNRISLPPQHQRFLRVSIFGAVFFITGLAWALSIYFRSSFNAKVNVPIEQPVRFSHEHHVAGLGVAASIATRQRRPQPLPAFHRHTCMTAQPDLGEQPDSGACA